MIKQLATAAMVLAVVACGAQMISSAGSSGSPYAPLNDGKRLGLVKYQIDGADFIVRRRREDAYKKMYESCGGRYLIVAEGAREENGMVVSTVTESGTA